VRRCLRDPTFSRFDTIPECDGHTDTQSKTTPLLGVICLPFDNT